MNKNKLRYTFIYFLLIFLLLLYALSFFTFIFGRFEDALLLFAYTTFFSVITHFLLRYQRRMGFWKNKDEE